MAAIRDLARIDLPQGGLYRSPARECVRSASPRTGGYARPTRLEASSTQIRGIPAIRARVEQGNPNSPYPNSREPYVRDLRNGQYRDAQGSVVPRDDPAGHIPLDQYPGYQP
jgi:hypothetical protein